MNDSILINLIGCYENNLTGYGVFTKGFWGALREFKNESLDFIFTDFRFSAQVSRSIELCEKFDGQVVNIWLQVGGGRAMLQKFPGVRIAFTMFEIDVLPIGWTDELNSADMVFTPSVWGRQIMINCGVQCGKIHVVPGGVDVGVYNPYGRGVTQIKSETFKFLMIGKYERRKSYEELLAAFGNSFGGSGGVELLIKANSFVDKDANRKIVEMAEALKLPNVKFIGGAVNDFTMASLYRSCDCFVFPSKGEGWGLPLIEAIACGLPVMTTFQTGHTEFLRCVPGGFFEIDAKYLPVDCDDFTKWYKFESKEGNWACPDVKSIEDGMVGAVRDRVKFAWQGELIREKFAWSVSASTALKHIFKYIA